MRIYRSPSSSVHALKLKAPTSRVGTAHAARGKSFRICEFPSPALFPHRGLLHAIRAIPSVLPLLLRHDVAQVMARRWGT